MTEGDYAFGPSIEKLRKNKEITFVTLTSSVMSDDLKSISQSFTNYIIKPYSFSDIDQVLIFFSGKEFEYMDDTVNSKKGDFIVIENELLKEDILNYAKLGQYKKLSQLIEKVEDKRSKELLKEYLNNYNFNEIINNIKDEVL